MVKEEWGTAKHSPPSAKGTASLEIKTLIAAHSFGDGSDEGNFPRMQKAAQGPRALGPNDRRSQEDRWSCQAG